MHGLIIGNILLVIIKWCNSIYLFYYQLSLEDVYGKFIWTTI